MRDFGDDVFAGAAKYYAKYRPKYPPELFRDAVQYFGLDGHGRLFDLGCGTGELALPLARYFSQVLAIDPEHGMLELGRQKAAAAGIHNITWRKGSSRSLKRVEGPFKLASLGQSLHWMDEEEVLKVLYGLIETNGGVLVVGSVPATQNEAVQAKDELIYGLIEKYLGFGRRAGWVMYKPSGRSWENDVFPNSEFGGFEKRKYTIKVVQNVDEIVGELYSKSWALRSHFGSRIDEFDNEIRTKLAGISQSEKFESNICFEVFFLKK
jgi:ubiquinone/menaquinone biosynthesis C-methylase UbiE